MPGKAAIQSAAAQAAARNLELSKTSSVAGLARDGRPACFKAWTNSQACAPERLYACCLIAQISVMDACGRETLGTVRRFSHEKNRERTGSLLRMECGQCSYLPKCMGGCEENLKTGDPCCLIERYMIADYLEYLGK